MGNKKDEVDTLGKWRGNKIVFSVTLLFGFLLGCSETQNTDDEPIVIEDGGKYEDIGLSKFDSNIDVSFVRGTTDNVRQLENRFPNDTLVENRWTELFYDVLGINVQFKWVEEDIVYHKKLANDLMSGDLADIVRVNRQQLRELERANLIEDLTEVYETYATPLTTQVMKQDEENPFEAAMINEKLMGIPVIGSSVDIAQYIWIRTDWLEQLELEPPETMDDVLEISKAFTHRDLNQNGNADHQFGLAISKFLWDPIMSLTGFMAGYQAYPTIWLEDESGNLMYGGIQPEVKDALLVLQQMYQDGQIDEEFFLKDGSKIKEQINNGEVGMLYGEQWAPFFVQGSKEIDSNAEWKAFPIVSSNEELPYVPIKNQSEYFWVVKSGFDHPEALVKMINLYLEKNWGETAEYETYYSTPHPIWQLAPISQSPPLKNYHAFLDIQEAQRNDTLDELVGEARAIQGKITDYVENNDMDGWGWYLAYGEEGAYSILDSYQANNQLLHDQMVHAPTDAVVEYIPILYNLQLDAYKSIIMGTPIDNFDEFVENWKRIGGDKMTDELNEVHHQR
ncbi:extracellular solute-binding protein [Alkalicoccobacillus porphyridii]|uniref:Extracellular solute-binding protein n=1 Tax=Alkalicoccobacillus porphyridii TaxID=2597270 RepID=A0A554A2E2_9BACI|nr:extracellular solute-binding protein [Alkalicoccobacillus porphyridii]TSB47859.1 extracellular solute-binding protein [Alkalicoccobacillus porphyridii]